MNLYLSRLTFNTRDVAARNILGDWYGLHRLLWSAFPDAERGGAGRVLFRVDAATSNCLPRAVVQSDLEPNWEEIEQRSLLRERVSLRVLSPQLAEGDRLRFLLRANPTRREPGRHAIHPETGKPKDGPRRALLREDEQREWLDRHGRAGGFRPLDVQVNDRGVIDVRKPPSVRIRYACIDFEGIIEVTDPDALLVTLRNGIGSAKGFGFGLLSLARA